MISNIFRNVICGFCEIIDGLVRVLSLGFIHSGFTWAWLVYWEKKEINKKITTIKE